MDMMQYQWVTGISVFLIFIDNFLEKGSNSYLNIVCMYSPAKQHLAHMFDA